MEEQLEALGIRWTIVCRWMEERSAALTEAESRWRVFSERFKAFVAWLTDTQDVLGDIEKRWTQDGVSSLDENVAEVHDVVEQVQCLKVSAELYSTTASVHHCQFFSAESVYFLHFTDYAAQSPCGFL